MELCQTPRTGAISLSYIYTDNAHIQAIPYYSHALGTCPGSLSLRFWLFSSIYCKSLIISDEDPTKVSLSTIPTPGQITSHFGFSYQLAQILLQDGRV